VLPQFPFVAFPFIRRTTAWAGIAPAASRSVRRQLISGVLTIMV